MTDSKITYRIELLFRCLQFSSEKTAMLTVGQRIIINQEIGSLLLMLNNKNAQHRPVTELVENKITEIKNLMNVYQFVGLGLPPYEPFNIE